MMLADISAADPKHLQDFMVIGIGIAVFLGGMISLAIQWITAQKSGRAQVQQPLVVQWGEMDRRLTASEAAILELRRDMKDDREQQNHDADERARRMYERIEELEKRLSAMPAELVALLKNTGVIK